MNKLGREIIGQKLAALKAWEAALGAMSYIDKMIDSDPMRTNPHHRQRNKLDHEDEALRTIRYAIYEELAKRRGDVLEIIALNSNIANEGYDAGVLRDIDAFKRNIRERLGLVFDNADWEKAK